MADTLGPLRVDTRTTPDSNAPTAPPIAAAFLVNFDHRKGYVLAWQRSLDGIKVEGSVELKSLPSGLHNVEEDLIYFVHNDCIGISAYINKPDDKSARNANMLAVGVLVPLHHGRLAKSWLHAPALKDVARQLISNLSDTMPLQEYWDDHKIQFSTQQAPEESTDDLFHSKGRQPNGYQKFRSMSTGSNFVPGSVHTLAAHHPAATLMHFFDIFGPLIFPLYRFALLRQRILILSDAPVEFACNIVYNLSILASLPRSLQHLLATTNPSANPSCLRPQPLFTVGITDIPLLSTPTSSGWIANTTDDVLATKPECFDILVLIPSNDAQQARQKVYPRIIVSDPELSQRFPRTSVRASQRDALRYRILRETLRTVPSSIVATEGEETDPKDAEQVEEAVVDSNDDRRSAISTTPSTTSTIQDRRNIVESPSWSQVAYTSLLWWASAGDRRAGLTDAEEAQREVEMQLVEGEGGDEDHAERTKEIVLVGYVRRLTECLVKGLGDVIMPESADGDGIEAEDDQTDNIDEDARRDGDAEDDDATAEPDASHDDNADTYPLLQSAKSPSPSQTQTQRQAPSKDTPAADQTTDTEILQITPEDLSAMALDMWSSSDRKFVEEFVNIYFGRQVRVTGMGVECCGVRIL